MMLLESHRSPQKSEIYLTFLFSTYLEAKFGHVGQVAELSCFYHWKEWLVNYKISQKIEMEFNFFFVYEFVSICTFKKIHKLNGFTSLLVVITVVTAKL